MGYDEFLAVASFSMTIYILTRLGSANRLLSRPATLDGMRYDELPTVSVCIPARNETHAMNDCLERVLQSDYPKLEIIVLDDASTDDTSALIRSFASAGVRFIPGSDLPDGWLGKNHALKTMADEASGSYLCFMDVDTQLSPTTITQVVATALRDRAAMVSAIPTRYDVTRASALLRSLRYLWELVLSSSRRPPTSSALWLIERSAFINSNFDTYRQSVRPEAELATVFYKAKRHHTLVPTPVFSLGYEKKLSSQHETAIRLYYPMVGQRFGVTLAAVCCLILVALSAPLLIIGIVQHHLIGSIFAGFGVLWGYLLYWRFLRVTNSKYAALAALLWPLLILIELYLLLRSIIGYKAHSITWKGRPVTAPSLNTAKFEINE